MNANSMRTSDQFEWNEPPVPASGRRRLRVFAFDPMTSRLTAARSASGFLTVSVPMEPLKRGPAGRMVHVVDYHPPTGTWFWPVDLEDTKLALTDGLRPSESDPRSHQQMVYAVASHVIERFERFLGRRFRWRRHDVLVLIPHAFEGRNAFFDPSRQAVLFGYFTASRDDPGANLPGQRIFTCLSMDIIAHEVTHALVNRLRPNFIQPTNPDVLAWHEAFADLVALLHHFAFENVVRESVASSRGDLTQAAGLFDLAAEFGASTGRGAALRSAIKQVQTTAIVSNPSPPKPFSEVTEPHERGAVFVAAVFDAFVTSYSRSIEDLIRIATGGTGVLPPGHLHPDLVKRVTTEAVKLADRYLGMVVRAFDYMPVVDVTFGDVLRSIVTADRDLYPDDDAEMRGTLVEAFRRHGIYADDVPSLAEDSLAWPPAPDAFKVTDAVANELEWLVGHHAMELEPSGQQDGASRGRPSGDGQALATALREWASIPDVATVLGLEHRLPIKVEGQHASFRQTQDRQPQPEIVIQFLQRRKDLEPSVPGASDQLPVLAGTTVVMTMAGDVRYVISKPLPDLPDAADIDNQRPQTAGAARLERLTASLAQAEQENAASMWSPSTSSTTFQRLHIQVEGAD